MEVGARSIKEFYGGLRWADWLFLEAYKFSRDARSTKINIFIDR